MNREKFLTYFWRGKVYSYTNIEKSSLNYELLFPRVLHENKLAVFKEKITLDIFALQKIFLKKLRYLEVWKSRKRKCAVCTIMRQLGKKILLQIINLSYYS